MKTYKSKANFFIYATFFCFFFLILISVYRQINYIEKSSGKLEILSSDENYYYDEIHDIHFPGKNIDYTTYYFLPSYIKNDKIIQTSDTIKVYLENGELLQEARFGEVQSIYVDFGDGNKTPWKMCFMKSENINSVFINLDSPLEMDNIDTDYYTNASLTVFDEDGTIDYSDEKILLKGRGNTSWLPWAKKPLELKLSQKASICGLSPSSKWVLLANYFDATYMANKIAFDLANRIYLDFTTDSYWVDVFSNNEYLGNYLICKEPNISTTNVNIDNIELINDTLFSTAVYYESEDLSAYEYETPPSIVNGGYLIKKETEDSYEPKKCKFRVSGYPFVIKSPNNASVEQTEYIKNFIEEVNACIEDSANKNNVIDQDSFIKRFLIEEFLFNQDAYARSYYFYKKPSINKLFAGPCWDYDNAAGQEDEPEVFLDYTRSLSDKDVVAQRWTDKEMLNWDINLYHKDDSYRKHMMTIFSESRHEFESIIFEKIPEYRDTINASVMMDNIIWPETRKPYQRYDDNIRYLQFFLYQRLVSMSKMLEDHHPLKPFSVNSDETHTVTFITKGKKDSVITCHDGYQLSETDLPEYNKVLSHWEKKGLYYVNYSFFRPIYEDTVFELKEL